MHEHRTRLKTICDRRDIQRVAIIDDVFDVPAAQELNRTRYGEFRRCYNRDDDLKQALIDPVDSEFDSLPAFDDLDDDQLEPLWNAMWRHRLGYRTITSHYVDRLQQLFMDHRDDVLGMLEEIFDLYSLFHHELGRAVVVRGTDYEAHDIAQSQIVVVDYFFGPRLTDDEALGKLTEAVTTVVHSARAAEQPIPSFILVSNRAPDKIDINGFRRDSKLMRSRFGFFARAI